MSIVVDETTEERATATTRVERGSKAVAPTVEPSVRRPPWLRIAACAAVVAAISAAAMRSLCRARETRKTGINRSGKTGNVVCCSIRN